MIYDLHNDFLTGLDKSEYVNYLSRAAKHSVKGIVAAIWTTEFKKITEGFFSNIVNTVPVSAMSPVRGYAIEDLHFLDTCSVSVLDELPFMYVGLTWNYDNALAGGAHGSGNLSELGRKTLQEAKKRGIAVDTAHLNRKSFFSVIDKHDGKLLNSHCCFDKVNKHLRNLTDEQIKLLIERDGIIGITLESSFLTEGYAELNDVVRHIDYYVQHFGCGNLCIGTDFNGCKLPHGFIDYGAFRLLKIELLKLGYNCTDIDSVFYKNAEKFFA